MLSISSSSADCTSEEKNEIDYIERLFTNAQLTLQTIEGNPQK